MRFICKEKTEQHRSFLSSLIAERQSIINNPFILIGTLGKYV